MCSGNVLLYLCSGCDLGQAAAPEPLKAEVVHLHSEELLLPDGQQQPPILGDAGPADPLAFRREAVIALAFRIDLPGPNPDLITLRCVRRPP